MATDVVWGIAMVKNEADIIGPIVAHMRDQVDHVLIADNLSTDETPDILWASGAEVIVDDDPALASRPDLRDEISLMLTPEEAAYLFKS